MELHERDAALRPREMLRKRPRHKSLPRPRRTLEDDLPLVFKQGLDFLQEILGEAQVLGEVCHVGFGGSGRRRRIGVGFVIARVINPDVIVVSHDAPDDGLRFETVVQRQVARRRFFYDPVEKAQRVFVQRRFICVAVARVIPDALVSVVEHGDSEWGIIRRAHAHQQSGDDAHSASRRASYGFGRKEGAEIPNPSRDQHAV